MISELIYIPRVLTDQSFAHLDSLLMNVIFSDELTHREVYVILDMLLPL